MDKNTIIGITGRILGKPLLVSPKFANMLAQCFYGGIIVEAIKAYREQTIGKNAKANFVDGIAIIPVSGYLSNHFDEEIYYMYGGTTYDTIRALFQQALADPTVKNIIFDINSPGGEAAGVFDLVDEIYNARGQKPIYAIFNDDGLSAAYAIASAADKRIVTRTSSVGSIGVVSIHVDQSGYDTQRGLVYTPIFAGQHKIDFSSHFPLSEEAKAVAQSDVNEIYNVFAETVARNLGLKVDDVKATEAGIFSGKKAVQAGLADSVMSWSQFMQKLNTRKYGGVMKLEIEKMFNALKESFLALAGEGRSADNVEVGMVSKEEADKFIMAVYEAAKAEAHVTGKSEGVLEGAKAQKERVGGIMQACIVAGMDMAFALNLINDDAQTVETIGDAIVAEKAKRQKSCHITSSVGATTTGAANELINDALKRAGKEK